SCGSRGRGLPFVGIMHLHALPSPIPLECHQRASPRSMAKPIPAVAHRNLHRRQDERDWLCRILGIHVAGAKRTLALPALDRRDGALDSAEAESLSVPKMAHTLRPKNRFNVQLILGFLLGIVASLLC